MEDEDLVFNLQLEEAISGTLLQHSDPPPPPHPRKSKRNARLVSVSRRWSARILRTLVLVLGLQFLIHVASRSSRLRNPCLELQTKPLCLSGFEFCYMCGARLEEGAGEDGEGWEFMTGCVCPFFGEEEDD